MLVSNVPRHSCGHSLVVLVATALALGLFSCFHSASFSAADNQPTASATTLHAGESSERELAPAEVHLYQVELNTNQYLRLVLEETAINLALSIKSPDSHIVIQLEGRNYGPTPISLSADQSGFYQLEIKSLEQDQSRGNYKLRVAELREATPVDRQTIAAETAFATAESLLREWKAESSRRAIEQFKQAAALFRDTGDRGDEALALKRIGDVYQRFNESKDALDSYNQALALTRQLKDARHEAETLNEIGYVYLNRGENQQARQICAEALKLSQSTGNLSGQARALNNLGEVSYGQGRLQESLDFYQKSLQLWRDLGNRPGQALALLNSAYTYSDIGQMREAIDHYTQSLDLWTSARDQRGRAMTLTAIGRLYSRKSESQQALNYFEQAMELIEPMGVPAEKGRVLTGLADVYNQLSRKREAIEYYEQALPLFRAAGDYSGEVVCVFDPGNVLYSLGENQAALEHYQETLSIAKRANDRRLQAFVVRQMGRVYGSLGDEAKALALYQQSLAFWHTEKDLRAESETLNPIAQILEWRGEKQQAREYYSRALTLSRQAEYQLGEAATLYNLARLERDDGHLIAARDMAQSAIEVIEALRTKVASQELRASYFASVRQHYELFIDILMQLDKAHPEDKFAAQAFAISEKARARSLLESLQESRTDIRSGVDASLLEQERLLQESLYEKNKRHAQILNNKSDAAEAESLAREIDRLSIKYEDIRAQIKKSSPHYAALTQPQPLSLEQVQQNLLDEQTALLEYTLGDERSYVWAVTRHEVKTYQLAPRAEIERSAQRLYELLTVNQHLAQQTPGAAQADPDEIGKQRSAEITTLSALLLAPVASQLEKKRLLIIPDGALQYVPFQALQARSASSDALEPRPLVFDHEIINQPSASALALVIKEAGDHTARSGSVAILADPVFEADDSRVKSGTGSSSPAVTAASASEVTSALRDVGVEGASIPRLLSSREEADAIMSVVPWRTGLKAVDFQASRATVMGKDLGQYRIVHFATHALLNNDHPEMSGIVLSLVNESGQRQEGYLRLHDIYNLKLPVDLVVLSACQTGLGKDVKGEGLIGLTRGFMYAGASGVIASLWKVDDEATAALMKHFYHGLFDKGLTPAAALREAQLALRQQKRWQDPYYWAGFVIQGQYDHTVALGYRSKSWQVAGLVALGTGLLAAILFVLHRSRHRAQLPQT